MAIATGSEERSPSPDTQDPCQQAVISDYDEFVAEVGEFGNTTTVHKVPRILCLRLSPAA